MQVIIYPNGSGISVIYPAVDTELTIQEVASKDVPQGVPYRIVDASDIPSDRANRALWTADFSSPDGHGGTP